jgi:signal transduction histidine kinase
VKRIAWFTRDRSVGGRPMPSALDWLVAAGLVVVALIEAIGGLYPGPVALAAVVLVASNLTVAFRRVAPVPAIAASVLVTLPFVFTYARQFNGGSVANAAMDLLIIYSVGRHATGRALVVGAACALLLSLEPGIGGRQTGPAEWAFTLIYGAGVLVLGMALRIQTVRSISLAVAAERARSEQGATARAAVHEERARIASELHDVVAHNVGLIVLQAGGARSVLGSDPERTRTALQQVEETGRQTLTEMRHLVGILRVDEAADCAADRRPPQTESQPESSSNAAAVDGVGARRAPSALDWLVALALAIVAMLEAVNGVFPGPLAIVVVVQLTATLPVAFRRVAPLPAIAIGAAVYLPYVVVYGAGNSVANMATELLLIYSVGRHVAGRRLLVGAAVSLLLVVEDLVGARLLLSLSDWAYLLILFGGALGLGVALRVQVERSIWLAVAAERARNEQGSTARAAVREERARIARELHDVVADKVGLIVLQAGGARSVLDAEPERARAALQHVEETGRQTLAEMRQLVGILRVEEGADRQPLPRLERLPALVEETRAAGHTVALAVEGPVVGLPAGVELAVYRVIQEALTNVRKHAPTSRAEVRLCYEPDRVRIEVSDDGGPSGAGSETAHDTTGPGHGLIGMRERVNLYGGRMQAGPMPDRGFRVEAVLPLALELT